MFIFLEKNRMLIVISQRHTHCPLYAPICFPRQVNSPKFCAQMLWMFCGENLQNFLSLHPNPSSLDPYFYLHFIAALHVFYYKALQIIFGSG